MWSATAVIKVVVHHGWQLFFCQKHHWWNCSLYVKSFPHLEKVVSNSIGSLIFKSAKVWGYNSKVVYVLLLNYVKEIKLLKFPAPFSIVPAAQYIWTTLWYDMQTFALTRRSRDCSIFKNSKGGELDYDIVCQAILVGMLLMAKRLDGSSSNIFVAWTLPF